MGRSKIIFAIALLLAATGVARGEGAHEEQAAATGVARGEGAHEEGTHSALAHEAGGPGGHELVTNPIENFARVHYGRDRHGGGYEPKKGDEKMPPPFLAALLNFGLLAFLFGKFAAPSVAKMVRDRHDTVARQLKESASLRDEARRKLQDYTQKLDSLEGEIATLVGDIRKEAEREGKRIIADAQTRAEQTRRDAEAQIQAELQRLRVTLEKETVLAAVTMAERILREKTTLADQRALTERFVSQLEERKP